MKRITIVCTIAMMLCGILAQGQNRIVTERDSLGNKKRVIELRDTVVNGKTTTDTLSITTYEGTDTNEENADEYSYEGSYWDLPDIIDATMLIPIVAIVATFGMPVLIIFLIFFFRYKNRKAKYRMAEQILASGQPLPGNFFSTSSTETADTRSKGIKNAFLGLGLFIFLWAITDEFSIGCIGLLVMCIGLGQIVIHYTQEKKDKPE